VYTSYTGESAVVGITSVRDERYTFKEDNMAKRKAASKRKSVKSKVSRTTKRKATTKRKRKSSGGAFFIDDVPTLI